METTFNLKSGEIESKLSECVKKGMTEFSLYDDEYANNKGKMLSFIKTVQTTSPDLFVSIVINPYILDMEIARECTKINCSLEIPLEPAKNGFFDKKFFTRRATMLNNASLVFGFRLSYADFEKDSLKFFKERLDFAISQFPNHITFLQTESSELSETAKVSQIFSAKEIRIARNIAFACRTFYSAGRAVPWFNTVLHALKISSSTFFSDFSEWQRCNNCDFNSGFIPENLMHNEIEKMQLLFLQEKFEEKNKIHLFKALTDIVSLNGALSRLVSDGTESVLETEYNPEEIFSPESMDLSSFVNDVCMEHCTVKVFINDSGEPDFKVY